MKTTEVGYTRMSSPKQNTPNFNEDNYDVSKASYTPVGGSYFGNKDNYPRLHFCISTRDIANHLLPLHTILS